MDEFLITEKEQALYRMFLTNTEYIRIAEITEHKQSAVVNIVKRTRSVKEDTKLVYECLNIACYVRMKERRDTITNALKVLRKTPEVRVYNNLKDSDKWI